MKKFLLGIILPVLTLVTLIGTGFATWYFDTSLKATQDTATTTVTVEKYAQIGTVEATNKTGLSLNFDQSTSKGDDGLKLVNGSKVEQTIEAKYTPASGNTNIDGTVPATFTITLELGDLAKYVDVDTTLDKGNGVKWKAGTAGTYTLTFTNVTALTTVSISSADFKYHATGDNTNKFAEPNSKDEYTKMYDIVTKGKVTIKLDASMTKPAA